MSSRQLKDESNVDTIIDDNPHLRFPDGHKIRLVCVDGLYALITKPGPHALSHETVRPLFEVERCLATAHPQDPSPFNEPSKGMLAAGVLAAAAATLILSAPPAQASAPRAAAVVKSSLINNVFGYRPAHGGRRRRL